MADKCPKTKLVNFRVDQEELTRIHEAREASGQSSLSDFARDRVLNAAHRRRVDFDEKLGARLSLVETRLDDVLNSIRRLVTFFEPDGPADCVLGPEDVEALRTRQHLPS